MRLCGKRPVAERLRCSPKTIRALVLEKGTDNPEVVHAAKQAGVPWTVLKRDEFSRKAGTLHAQGVLAEVEPYRTVLLENLLSARDKGLSFFLLDRVTDPQNLGNILRNIACLGRSAVILPRHDSAEVNETVLRVACGGENHVPVVCVTNLIQACELLKRSGYWIAGAVTEGGVLLHEVKLPAPLAVVFGSEGGGIRPGLMKHLELTFTLPMPGAKLSYNVATAAALTAYEILRQKT
ncbi:MAG: RNA methyltransferase [Candidatus Omnitrophica bacterium]|nr:RNA methyltransferase [Candidatus Omnitrophota bacterium]